MGRAATVEIPTSSYNIIDLGAYRPEDRPTEQGVLNTQKISLFPGGTSQIGREYTKLLADAGCRLVIWTQDLDKAKGVQQEICVSGGVVPDAYQVNLRSFDDIDRAWEKMNLPKGQSIDFYPWSVASLDSMTIQEEGRRIPTSLKRLIAAVIAKVRKGAIPLDQGTVDIKKIVQKPEILDQAREINRGLLYVMDKAAENGNLNGDSLVETISSSLSDAADTENLDNNNPAIYTAIGVPKEELKKEAQQKARLYGCRFINIVAPEVIGTVIAKFLDGIVGDLEEAMDNGLQERIDVPPIAKILLMDLVETIFGEMMYRGNAGPDGNLYIKGLNIVSPTRPPEWNVKYPL